jgi:hypothetical protein
MHTYMNIMYLCDNAWCSRVTDSPQILQKVIITCITLYLSVCVYTKPQFVYISVHVDLR